MYARSIVESRLNHGAGGGAGGGMGIVKVGNDTSVVTGSIHVPVFTYTYIIPTKVYLPAYLKRSSALLLHAMMRDEQDGR